MNKVFINSDWEKKFDIDGFVIVRAFDEALCNQLIQKHDSFKPDDISDNFYATQNSMNYKYRRAVEDLLHPIFTEKLKPLFIDHKVLYTQYMVKNSGINGECHMHQDWTFVEEPAHYSVNFWCALQDVNEGNGCIWVMPGSHKLDNYYRGRNIISSTQKQQEFIRKYLMKPVILKKGEAILFNSRLVHESRNNTSGQNRIAAAAMIIPNNTQPIHYMRINEQDDHVIELNVDSNFFVDNSCRTMPADYSGAKKFQYPQKYFNKLELISTWIRSSAKFSKTVSMN